MILGTHNSATGGKLLWWLKPFAWLINLTSKCQNKTIADQLHDGVRLFNLQVAHYKNSWKFSHGLALYKEDVLETLKYMKQIASNKDPIYFQLYLDKSFWCEQNQFEFAKLIACIKKQFCCPYFVMLFAQIEGTNKYPHKSCSKISVSEHYWSLSWAKEQSNLINKLPLLKYHAKKYNKLYKDSCKSDYLMLDYYQI